MKVKRIFDRRWIFLPFLFMALLDSCATRQSEMSRFYRECEGRISYVMCPSAPRSYQAVALNKNGTLAKLSDKETQAMSIFLGQGGTQEKVEKLDALGYASTRGVDVLEFLLCSQYATCELSREQYSQIRQDILPVLEKR